MWLFLFGSGIGASVTIGSIDYRDYIYPGILAMMVLFGSVYFGLYIVWDRKLDVLKAILVAPVSRVSIFLGKVLGRVHGCYSTGYCPFCGIIFVPGDKPMGNTAGPNFIGHYGNSPGFFRTGAGLAFSKPGGISGDFIVSNFPAFFSVGRAFPDNG